MLNDISLELHRGEVVLLQGGNGSGKTTLLNILTGNLKPDRGSIELFANHTLTRFNFPQPWYSLGATLGNAGFAPERLSRQGIGRSWQDIRLFSSQTLRDNIAVAAPNQSGENPIVALFSAKNVQSQERHLRQDVTERLGRLGLSDRENSSADKVSLGQAKRVAIIRAVQTGAKILFLDEPLAGLDAPGATSVLNLLQELVREHSLCLVIVEHVFNIPRVLSLTSTVWTLENGLHIDEASQISPTQENAQEEEKEFGWARELGASEQENLPGEATLTRFCDASSSATLPPSTHSSSVIPAQLPIDARIHAQGSASPGREVILEVEDLAVVRGARQVIGQESQKGLSFCLRRGEVLVLRAPNGWGKTTLFEALAGLVPPTRGTIRLFGQAVENLPVWERRKRGLGLLQARNHTFPGLTVRETLHMTGIRSWPSALDSLLQRRISSLSGGEKQQVALECVLGHADVPILLLDEPFSALDAVAISDVIERVKARLPYCGVLIALPASREAHHHEARHHEDSEREKN